MDTDEMEDCVEGALLAIKGETGWDLLSDNREIGTPATPAQIKKLLWLLSRDGTALRGRKAATVVSQAASFGMMRLLGAHASGLDIEVGVFWKMEDAMEFLGRPDAV